MEIERQDMLDTMDTLSELAGRMRKMADDAEQAVETLLRVWGGAEVR